MRDTLDARLHPHPGGSVRAVSSRSADEAATAGGRTVRRPTAEDHPHGPGVGDRRGLTAAGAVTLALLLGIVGGSVDVATGRGLRVVFAICFVLGCALAALLVHREDLKAAVVMPPLLYVVLALVAGAVGSTGGSGSFLTRETLELVQALVIGAPVLFTATGVAAVVALARWLSPRRSR